jgi:hypothetical protein
MDNPFLWKGRYRRVSLCMMRNSACRGRRAKLNGAFDAGATTMTNYAALPDLLPDRYGFGAI